VAIAEPSELALDDRAFLEAGRPFWHPVAYSHELGEGAVVPVTLLGTELAVWRAADGTIGVVDDLCVHRGTRLSLGSVSTAGCVRCPYHGWEYDRDGACTRIPQLPDGPIPPKALVEAHQAREGSGLVWVCLASPGEEARGIPALPHAGEEGYHVHCGTSFSIACQAPRQVENTFDFAHFSVLHASIFGNPDRCEVDPYDVRRPDPHALEVDYTYHAINPVEPPAPDGSRPSMPTRYHYRIELPFASMFTLEIEGQPTVTLMTASQPVSATESHLWWVAESPEGELDDEIAEAVNMAILMQDKPVVESQRPERLPLDLTEELHLGFDKFAVTYRRALRELGFPVA
jgi:phenylpropionate dioxygenase-like ring-hydroxylating dioxygenase large terminal subunit